MPELRELLQRADRAVQEGVPLPASGFEGLTRRRDRRRRSQRIFAGVVGAAIALAVALAGARALLMEPQPADTPSPAPPSLKLDPFIGVPPEGAEPSTPVTGELVLSLDTTVSYGESFKTRLYVYADGRMIWERHAAPTGVLEGAKERNTGYLEQVLTPEGVEALRSEALDSRLFEDDLYLRGDFHDSVADIYGVSIHVLGDDGMVALEWARGNPDERRPTQAEMDTIGSLIDRLEDPGAWLPDTAWEDRGIRAFVASSYGVNFSLVTKPNGKCCMHPDPSQLPPPADELLSTQFNQCLTTDEARAIADGFGAAGIAPEAGTGFEPGGNEYDTGAEGADGIPQLMLLYPILPHYEGC